MKSVQSHLHVKGEIWPWVSRLFVVLASLFAYGRHFTQFIADI